MLNHEAQVNLSTKIYPSCLGNCETVLKGYKAIKTQDDGFMVNLSNSIS